MHTRTRVRLVKIGNSQGIRLPKALIEQAGLTGELDIEAEPGRLVISPARSARQGWDAQFEAMSQAGDDRLLDDEPVALTTWEAAEWDW
jgi:antitoxin MazE